MSGLAITQAPTPSLPMRFLLAAPAWGMFAGVWLAVQGEGALMSRWAPATVVLVHVVVLGVLGNAMLGALTQFLPVAALSPLVGRRALPLLHVGLNAGLLCFVVGLSKGVGLALHLAALLLGGTLLAFAALVGVALFRGKGPRWLRGGLCVALFSLALTAVLGVLGLLALTGDVSVALERVVDVHASFGLVGWVLMLIAVVGAMTLPMLQGTRAVPPRWVVGWVVCTLVGLLAGAVMRAWAGAALLAATTLAASWTFAAASLWLQLRSPHRRNPVLRYSWTVGVVAIACAVALMPFESVGAKTALWVGTLALGIGLPVLVTGMTMEIVSFLAWIHLRGVVPRGRQIPGVGRLLPEADKRIVLALHLIAAAGLLAALVLQKGHLASGLLIAIAHASTLFVLLRCRFRVVSEARIPVDRPRAPPVRG